MNIDEESLYAGLQALSDSAFPKKCANCGRQYDSPEEFVAQSEALGSGSGLKKSLDDDDQPIVELFRNCVCGSTLMDFFSDRRTTTDIGVKRRQVFSRMLETLEQRGMGVAESRQELLRLMRGERSPKLEQLGLRLETR